MSTIEQRTIADEGALKKAVSDIGRGNASHDARRKHVISRAKALKLGSLIPDNWSADGSLKETNGVWSTKEQRATYNDLSAALTQAISDTLPDDDSGDHYCWVQDFTDQWVVYQANNDLLRAPYTQDGDSITIGKPVKVRPVTTYVEMNSMRSRERRSDTMACPNCGGTGQVDGQDCPECDGTGQVPAATADAGAGADGQGRSADPVLERRRRVAANLEGTFETRRFEANSLELRDTSDGMLRFTGYASVTEHPYEVADFTETISRGAFKRTLGEGPDVVLLVNHEGLPLARTKSGTLTLTEDARGLRVDADLDPDDPDVRALEPKMRRGDVDQMSFAFRATDQEWSEDYSERRISQVSIHRGDVSVVTMGANEQATGTVLRSTDGEFELRAGKAISAANQTTLQGVLDRIARADVEIDASQAELSGVLGVDNPDQDDEAGEPDVPAARSLNYTAIRARERLLKLERGIR